MRYQKFLALLPALLLCAAPSFSQAAVAVSFSVNIAPPLLPVYVQPALPAPGYIWTPGYWAWDGMDYYWVPGTWVLPPASDMLWTPGYWGWHGGFYGWNPGYWGPTVGYYGGVNYGFGYTGVGYQGGYWHGGAFFYNRSVVNFGHVHVVNIYSAPIHIHETSRVSFNGGQGGLQWHPNAAERTAMNEHHRDPTPVQRQHEYGAASMPAMHLSQNGGQPQILTTGRPGDFDHPGPGPHNHAQPGHASPAMQGPGPQPQQAQHVQQGPPPQHGPPQQGPHPQQGQHPQGQHPQGEHPQGQHQSEPKHDR